MRSKFKYNPAEITSAYMHARQPRGPMSTILVIDDDALLREMVASHLRRAGHAVLLAANGAEGLAAFSRAPCDLVITDIVMPEKEGLETIRAMRKGWPHIPVVAMTGGARPMASGVEAGADYLEMASLLGARATVRKPFTGKQIVAVVEKLLAGPSA